MLHKNLLTCAGKPAIFLYNLTKNLTSQSAHPNRAVLPYTERQRPIVSDQTNDFHPILRFAVCSDIHMHTRSDERAERLRRLIRSVYARAAEDAAYKAVDAVLFCGDLTDFGTEAMVTDFWQVVQEELHSDTQALSILAKCHDNWSEGESRDNPKTGLAYYRAVTGLPTSFCTVIGGCAFVGVSTSEETGVYYDDGQREWLRQTLDKVSAQIPDKPIFVLQHEPICGTVFGSMPEDGWGNDFFQDIFFDYPQIVHFSGHSHYPINDPRSLWQGACTAVGTGALSYAELTADGVRKIHPPGHENIAQGWIAELDGRNRLRLRGFDFLSGALQCDYLLDLSDPPRTFAFTPQSCRARCGPPAFAPQAELRAERTDDGVLLTIPPARCGDGAPVVLYRVFCTDADGNTLCETVVFPAYWRADETPLHALLPCPQGELKIQVLAENAFGIKSKILKKERYDGT